MTAMSLGPYASFIVTSYVLVTAVVVMLIAWILIDYRRQKQILHELDSVLQDFTGKTVPESRIGTAVARLLEALGV